METVAPRAIRVCVTGPESTGKTTLAARLAARFETIWVPEFAREYALANPRPLTRDDVEPIARGQIANEERLLAGAKKLIVFDTDLVSTMVYARYYYDYVPEWIAAEAAARVADLYLMLDIDVPFIGDAARDAEEDRGAHLVLFRSALAAQGREVVVIRGDWEERYQRAVAAVERLLRRANLRVNPLPTGEAT